MKARRSAFAAGLLATLLVLISCGGDDDSGSGTQPRPLAGNSSLTISGTPPQSVTAGQPYQFQATAGNVNGESLTFSISGRPDWARFNTSNGRLSGTPTPGDVGTYTNIRISVSDGQASAQLPAFSINVLAAGAASGSALLTWTPPTQRTDGSALTDLAGYRVYYGAASGNYSQTATIGAGIASYLVESLVPGRWYFAVSAFDSAGRESALSAEVSKLISP